MTWGNRPIRFRSLIVMTGLALFSTYAFTDDDPFLNRQSDVVGASGDNNQGAMLNLTVANPAALKVPCTDTTQLEAPVGPGAFPDDLKGPAEFGQVPCTKAKPMLKTNITDKVKHMMAYYYEGKYVQFMSAMPGFCYLTDGTGNPVGPQTPICEIGTPSYGSREGHKNNWNQHECGKKIQDLTSFSAQNCFTARPPTEAACAPSPEAFTLYKMELDGMQNFVNACHNPGNGHACNPDCAKYKDSNGNPYNCKDPWLPAQLWTKQQEINDIDDFKAKMILKWNAYLAAGNEYCLFTPDGFKLNTCGKEAAWLRGFRISLWKKYLEEVKAEIDNGELTLTSIESINDPAQKVKPCLENAMSVQYQLNGQPSDPKNRPGLRAAEQWVRNRYKPLKDKLGIQNKDGCLGIDITDGTKAMQEINAAFDALGRHKNANDQVSLAVCNLMIMRKRNLMTFDRVAMCEIDTRTKRDLYEKVTNNANLWGKLKKELVDPCIDFAMDKKSLNPFGSWCTESCIVKWFNRCYKGTAGPGDGVEKWFYNWSRANLPYNQPLAADKLKIIAPPTPPKAIADQATPVAPTLPPGWVVGDPVPDNQVPKCEDVNDAGTGTYEGFGTGGLLAPIALKRFANKSRRRRRSWLAALFCGVLIAFVFAMGCGDDDPKEEEKAQYACTACGIPAKKANGDPWMCYLANSSDDAGCEDQAEATFCKHRCEGPEEEPKDGGEGEERQTEETVVDNSDVRDAGPKEGVIADEVVQNPDQGRTTSAATAGNFTRTDRNSGANAHEGQSLTADPKAPTSKINPGTAANGNGAISPTAGFGGGGTPGGGAATAGEAAESAALSADKNAAEFESNRNAPQQGRLIASSNTNLEGAPGSGGGSRAGDNGETGHVDTSGGQAAAGSDAQINKGPLSIFEIISRRYAKVAWKMENDSLGNAKPVLPSSNFIKK